MSRRTLRIGRDPASDITIDDPSVSRVHAELTQLPDGRCFLVDCGSRNGTWRCDRGQWTQVRQDWLEPGLRLRFGERDYTLEALLGLEDRAA